MLNAKHDSLDISEKLELKAKITGLEQNSKLNSDDIKEITRFLNSADLIYSDVEEMLKKGLDAARTLAEGNASEEEQNFARNTIHAAKDFVELSGRLLGCLFRNSSDKLKETLGKISDNLLRSCKPGEDFSTDSLFNFSPGSLNIDKLSFDNPEALKGALTTALETVKNNRDILSEIKRIFRENYIKPLTHDVNEIVNAFDIYI